MMRIVHEGIQNCRMRDEPWRWRRDRTRVVAVGGLRKSRADWGNRQGNSARCFLHSLNEIESLGRRFVSHQLHWGAIIRGRREALGLSHSRLARFTGLSRRMLAGLEAGVPSDVGVSRVPHLLSVLGLDLDLGTASESREPGHSA